MRDMEEEKRVGEEAVVEKKKKRKTSAVLTHQTFISLGFKYLILLILI